MNTNKTCRKFCIIGCGRLGTALSVFLPGPEYEVSAFACRTMQSAEAAREHAGGGVVCATAAEAVQTADIIFITTPDSQIESVCEQISNQGGFHNEQIVYHLSGALSSKILTSAGSCGASIGSIHPLQSFAPYKKADSSQFTGINISLEGDDIAVNEGETIVKALNARSFTIPTHAKTLYHAAAVVASNYLVTLEHFSLALLKEADLSEEQGFSILEPLIQGTLKNVKNRGTVEALTGPVARGDYKIISDHLADIDERLPHYSALYRLLGRHTLDIAEKNNVLSDDDKEKLRKLFL